MSLLKVEDLTIRFGGLTAVNKFHLTLEKGDLFGLIGPNGAGKTTIFNMLTGIYQPTEGDIKLEDTSIVGKKPFEIVNEGFSRTFQNIRLFKDLSVLDNLKIAYNNQMNYTVLEAIFRLPRYWKEEHTAHLECRNLLEIFDLLEYKNVKAKNLPYGKQRKLEIARALATNPKLLLLDEPAAGMNPQETKELMETIHFIRDKFDIAILLIEHDMNLVMEICERITVIDYGSVIAEGTPDEIKNNKDVIRAYLGE
jgi:branched-chain amino acid transport system ATP-binding protein